MKKILDWLENILVAMIVACIILGSIFVSIELAKTFEEIYETYQIKQKQLIQRQVLEQRTVFKQNAILTKQKIQNILKTELEKVQEEIKVLEEKLKIKSIKQKPSYQELKDVTVRIIGKKPEQLLMWTGTGIVIKITDDYTYILTNKHVAQKNALLYIVEKEKEYKAKVIKHAEKEDLALIRIYGKITNKKVIKGIADKIEPQNKVYSVGMYLSKKYIYTEGTMAGLNKDNQFIMNLPSAFGCSGSGVFNKDGELVGLIFGIYAYNYLAADTAKAICVNIDEIKIFLEGII